MLHYGVYSSRWPLGEQTLWTIVNRNEYDVEGRQMDVPASPGMRYFDLYHGVEIKPAPERRAGRAVICRPRPMATAPSSPRPPILTPKSRACFQDERMTAKPLASFSARMERYLSRSCEMHSTKPSEQRSGRMVRIPGGDFLFKV